MKLIEQIQVKLAERDALHLRRTRRHAQSACAPRVQVDGKAMLAFCSNDYLGLAAHPEIIAALKEGSDLYGVSSGASHLISGHTQAHADLETALAEFMAPVIPNADALYLCTGYMANLAILSGLGSISGKDTAIFCESLNHASLIDGVKLARAPMQIFPHGDMDALEDLLKNSSAKTKIVVSDSVFSMDGNLANLPRLVELCEQYDAWCVIDDAHGFGVLGAQGRGVLEHFNLCSKNVIYMGTLGKAAGVAGAFVAADAQVIDYLVQTARPYIYTTAAPPAIAYALLTSLKIIAGAEGQARRAHVQALIAQLRAGLNLQGWRLMPSITPIQPIVIGENAAAMQVAAQLHQQGFWIPAIRPPTVPAGTARLRLSLSASHTQEDVQELIDCLNAMNLEMSLEKTDASL